MISCRIVLNELPDNVIDQVLCVDEVTDQNPRWELISESPESRCYKFTPRPNAHSWFVRWGHHYTWKHFRDSLISQDEATQDWRNTGHAERHSIPVVHYRLLGTPRLLTGSLDTLLVTEFVENSRNLKSFIGDSQSNPVEKEDAIIKLGELLASIHSGGMQHNHFSLENVLIQYDDATRLTITDWYDMKLIGDGSPQSMSKDIKRILTDLREIDHHEYDSFITAYGQQMPWIHAEKESIIQEVESSNALAH